MHQQFTKQNSKLENTTAIHKTREQKRKHNGNWSDSNRNKYVLDNDSSSLIGCTVWQSATNRSTASLDFSADCMPCILLPLTGLGYITVRSVQETEVLAFAVFCDCDSVICYAIVFHTSGWPQLMLCCTVVLLCRYCLQTYHQRPHRNNKTKSLQTCQQLCQVCVCVYCVLESVDLSSQLSVGSAKCIRQCVYNFFSSFNNYLF